MQQLCRIIRKGLEQTKEAGTTARIPQFEGKRENKSLVVNECLSKPLRSKLVGCFTDLYTAA